MNASIGPERVFGFGASVPAVRGAEFVELLCELVIAGDSWRLGSPRWLDADDPLGSLEVSHGATSLRPIGEWVHAHSAVSLYRPQRRSQRSVD